MSPEVCTHKMNIAFVLFDYAIDIARCQHKYHRLFFLLEHPLRATSWKRLIDKLEQEPMEDTYFVTVDQCCLGLKSPRGEPMKKPTRFWTNCKRLAGELSGKRCCCKVPHCLIQGSQDGHKLSVWSQHYPPELCKLVARCVMA